MDDIEQSSEEIVISTTSWVIACAHGHTHVFGLTSPEISPDLALTHARTCPCENCAPCRDSMALIYMYYPMEGANYDAGGWKIEVVTDPDPATLAPAVWELTSPEGVTIHTTSSPAMLAGVVNMFINAARFEHRPKSPEDSP